MSISRAFKVGFAFPGLVALALGLGLRQSVFASSLAAGAAADILMEDPAPEVAEAISSLVEVGYFERVQSDILAEGPLQGARSFSRQLKGLGLDCCGPAALSALRVLSKSDFFEAYHARIAEAQAAAESGGEGAVVPAKSDHLALKKLLTKRAVRYGHEHHMSFAHVSQYDLSCVAGWNKQYRYQVLDFQTLPVESGWFKTTVPAVITVEISGQWRQGRRNDCRGDWQTVPHKAQYTWEVELPVTKTQAKLLSSSSNLQMTP